MLSILTWSDSLLLLLFSGSLVLLGAWIQRVMCNLSRRGVARYVLQTEKPSPNTTVAKQEKFGKSKKITETVCCFHLCFSKVDKVCICESKDTRSTDQR